CHNLTPAAYAVKFGLRREYAGEFAGGPAPDGGDPRMARGHGGRLHGMKWLLEGGIAMSIRTLLDDILSSSLSAPGIDWLHGAEAVVATRPLEIFRALAVAGRAVGRQPLALRPRDRAALRVLGLEWLFHGAPTDELARVVLVLAACEAAPAIGVGDLVAECY